MLAALAWILPGHPFSYVALSLTYTGFDAEGNVTERRRTNCSTKTLTYSYHNRIKSVTMSGNETGQVNFTYDSGGERFLKRYQTSGVDLYTYNMSSEYQMRRVSGEEIHTLLVNKADGALASLSFNSLYLISNAAAPASLYTRRIAADLREVSNLSSRNLGTKGPQIVRSVHRNTELLFASLIASWGERGGPPFFFENEKAKRRALHDTVVALFGIVSFVTLIALVRWWRKDRINLIWNLPRAFGRVTALALVVTFFSGVTNCVGVTSGGGNEISDGILAAAATSGAFQDPENPDIPALIAEMDGLIGNHFYITNQINSNHLVTDVNGKPVCKYVYEPYGKLNMNLTDTDPDKDGVHFLALKKFTGQEFDYETGLYNYNARLYDQETGRFLQPDPVHAEHVGYDNYDRYQYVHSNPVNFTDPTGETASGAGLVPHPAFQTLMALTLLTGVYNWLRYGAFEALTVNRYTGAGANRSPPPTKGTLQTGLIAFVILDMHQAAAPDIATAGKNWLVFEYYRTSYADSPDGLTETDKVSRIHDRDGPAFHKHKSLRANNRWVSGVWGKWASGEMLRNTAQREYDSTPGYWGPSRPLVAAVNTMATLVSELVVTVLGTILFKVTNFLNEIWYAWKNNPRLNVNSGRYHVNKARLRVRIGGWM